MKKYIFLLIFILACVGLSVSGIYYENYEAFLAVSQFKSGPEYIDAKVQMKMLGILRGFLYILQGATGFYVGYLFTISIANFFINKNKNKTIS